MDLHGAELYEYAENALAENLPLANEIKKNMICPVHNRKILFKYDYLHDGTHAYITRYCCLQHAQRVAKAFENAQLFDHIRIEDD